MKVAIIGKGNVGSALERGLGKNGHEVRTIGRNPAKVHDLAQWGDAIVLAVPYSQRENAVEEMGDAVRGKPLIDVTNCVDSNLECNGPGNLSGAEELQRMAKDARVVKAFNTVFANQMASGNVKGQPLTAFIAGDDAKAKEVATRLASDIGFEPVNAGPLANARWLEGMAHLNMNLAYKKGLGTDIGFHLQQPSGAPGEPEPRTERSGPPRPGREEWHPGQTATRQA